MHTPSNNMAERVPDGLVRIVTASAQETEELGHRLAGILKPGSVLALYGDLGAGKTVLTRGIARGLGIDEPVTSPTFTIVQEYACAGGGWFYHLDMYRINCEEDALAFGIEEFLFTPTAITVVEWPERIDGLLNDPYASAESAQRLGIVRIGHAGQDTRGVKISAHLVPWLAG